MHLSPCAHTCGCQPDDQAAAATVLKKHKVLPQISPTCTPSVFPHTLRAAPSVSVCRERGEFFPPRAIPGPWFPSALTQGVRCGKGLLEGGICRIFFPPW